MGWDLALIDVGKHSYFSRVGDATSRIVFLVYWSRLLSFFIFFYSGIGGRIADIRKRC